MKHLNVWGTLQRIKQLLHASWNETGSLSGTSHDYRLISGENEAGEGLWIFKSKSVKVLTTKIILMILSKKNILDNFIIVCFVSDKHILDRQIDQTSPSCVCSLP